MNCAKYSWGGIFDAVRALGGERAVIEMRSRRKLCDPVTPRQSVGFACFYARYEPEADAVRVWGYSDKTKEWRDPEEGYRGMETLREKWQGLRGRDGTWIEPMAPSWE